MVAKLNSVLMKSVGAAALSLAAASPAFASVTITIQQASDNLISTSFSGSLDLTGMTAYTAETEYFFMESSYATLHFGFVGPASTPYPYLYTYHMSGPTTWDLANVVGLAVSYAIADTFTGDHLMIEGNSGRLSISPDYVSGAALAGSEDFYGTLASLGLSAGSYVYTAGNNTITVNIGNTGNSGNNGNGDTNAVPEPATWALFIGGIGLVGGAMRRKRALAMAAA